MKPSPKMKSTTETITPTVAAEYLARNHPKNRPVRDYRVKQWVEELRKGRWKLTHQGIAFDDDGFLVDGQHRLTAIISAGIDAPMMVTRGVGIDTFAVLDQGAVRSVSDILGVSQRHAAVLRALIGLETYTPAFSTMPIADIEERYQRGAPDVDHILQVVRVGKNSLPFFNAPVFAALAYARPVAPQTVEDFAEQVRTGELISRTDPAYRFREWMMNRGKLRSPWDVAMATLQAFQHLIITGDQKIANLIVGESGYRIVTTQRRVKRLADTPDAKVVTSLSHRLNQAALK